MKDSDKPMHEDNDRTSADEQPLEVYEQLNRVNASTANALNSGLHSLHGLSFTEFLLMRTLADPASGALRRIDLADKLGMTASGVTRAILPLEKTGYVERIADKRDARASLATLPPSGAELVEHATATAAIAAASHLRGRLTGREVKQLATLLSKLDNQGL